MSGTGMMEIAVKSGLMKKHCKDNVSLYPLVIIQTYHPAIKLMNITANMAANILGLGWAATPAGLKAMRELQKLEEGGGTSF